MRKQIRSLIAAGMFVLMLALFGHELVPHEHGVVHAQSVHDASRWHPPTDHEHGDAPPAWIQVGGYTAGFDASHGFHGNTSALENTAKHTSMKGMLATFKDKAGGTQEVYLRVHIASNQMERGARYHSYEVFMRDSAGGVSHWQGWMNSGDPNPAAGQRRSRALNDPGTRPIVLVTDLAALQLGRNCEQWYAFTSSWGFDIGWTICDSTTLYFPEENQYPEVAVELCDYGYPRPTCLGSNRETELAWYGSDSAVAPNRGNPPKGTKFWSTQFGEFVSGANDPKCSTGQKTLKFGLEYQNVCLEQFISPTARAIENIPTVPNSNKFRKDYPVQGVVFPN